MWTTSTNGFGQYIEIFFTQSVIATKIKIRLKDNPRERIKTIRIYLDSDDFREICLENTNA